MSARHRNPDEMQARMFPLVHTEKDLRVTFRQRRELLENAPEHLNKPGGHYRECIINKRDCPLLHVKDEDRPIMLNVLSQYVNHEYSDLFLPPVVDYVRASMGSHLGTKHVPSIDVKVPAWNTRKSAAVFRGSATGAGVTRDTNMRLRLCALSKTWEETERHVPPLLDARLTSWNPRHKWNSYGTFDIIDPSTAAPPLTPRSGASCKYRMNMEQQGRWKYYVLVDGNMGASRLGELAQRCFLILWVRSNLPQVCHAYENLIAWKHYVPIASDLSDLEEQIIWSKDHDQEAQKIAQAMHTLLVPKLSQESLQLMLNASLQMLPAPLSQENFEHALRWLWENKRSGIYVLFDPYGELLMFKPFANENYCNVWASTIPREIFDELKKTHRRLWPTSKGKIIADPRRWWSNGCLVCNVMPHGIWGESMLPEIHAMLVSAGHF